MRYGRLAAAGTVPAHAQPRPYVDALIATAETVFPPAGEAPGGVALGAPPSAGATAEEMECVLRWLGLPGVRLVEVDGPWTCPAHGAEGLRERIDKGYERYEPSHPRGGRPLR
ncbi:exonuclease%2C DNA polymerase III subunit epsilon family [Mycobacterium tuberculosis]|nr:exonuclease%2C DNA polymerase III subunit epsilon family [Mycobacterium tuberculosis]